jgi:hypothetical protein
MTSTDDAVRESLMLEHRALRDEILLRIRQQHELLALTWAAFGLLVAFGLHLVSAPLLVLYVLLATFTAASWQHNGARTVQLKTYLRDDLEPRLFGDGGGGWEEALAGMGVKGLLGSCWFVGTKGFFFGSQSLATCLAVVLAVNGPAAGGAALIPIIPAILAQVATVCVLRYPRIERSRT